MKIAILGTGSRGANVYASEFKKIPGVEISALCDVNEERLISTANRFDVRENCFNNECDFFTKGVLADGLVIASMDQDHYRQVMKGIKAGYKKILLEKPVSDKLQEVEEIAKIAAIEKVEILVCHVLRYSAFYRTIKDIIDSGKIGKVTAINHQENIAHWHFAHSFTRGNWRDEKTSAPILLAKTCHDFDLLYWFASSAKCTEVMSYAQLSHFKKECAPEGCEKRCLDNCKYLDRCPYSVKRLYLDKNTPLSWGILQAIGKNNPTYDEKIKALKDPNNLYGRCVYYCDNNVADHQAVIMKFENDIIATLNMTAFSNDCYRRVHILGTKGEILGDDQHNYLTLNIFGEKKNCIQKLNKNRVQIKSPIKTGHLGGDAGLVRVFYSLINGDKIDNNYLTTIDVTLESHKTIFFAEKARRTGQTQKIQ